MEIKKIAVLGAGNGGFMSAADMALMGYEVTIFDTLPGKLDGVMKTGTIEVCDIDSKPTGEVGKIALATENVEEAIKGADVILNPAPFFAVKHYAEAAAKYISEGQVIICLGKGGASLVWKKALDEAGNKSRVYLADCNTLPYGASRLNDTQVRLESRTMNLMFAAFPAKDMDFVWTILNELYPPEHGYTLRRGQNVIDTLLVDYNAITHTPPMICNAAVIDSGDPDFHLFGVKENPKPVVNLIEAIDRERMAIGEKLGLKQYTLEEEIKMVKWNRDGVDEVLPIYEAIHTPFLEVCEGPFKLNVRHLVEDVPYGLVTYSSLGKLLGVPTPMSDAITTIAEGLLSRDFRSEGRDITALGLNPDWSVEQVKQFLYEGAVD
ncbi:MAG: NAD/NADP octopine/nopaline dehydrogenase family protein [Lachnospiraceae bacterium]|jgi:opine dehydrogenase|nr:NAD/NADP octopine/nopaline dehydrogenase family protein [Lachnospiraceae bacterium]